MMVARSSPELDENDMEASYFNGKSMGRKRAARQTHLGDLRGDGGSKLS
jgi:hypothetical protein